MDRTIQLTADGSHTIALGNTAVTYHSRFGAIQESRHVFITAGMQPLLGKYGCLRVLEMGLGTGLNALLTWEEAIVAQQPVIYHGIELYPLTPAELRQLNYGQLLHGTHAQPHFDALHNAAWEQDVQVHELFTLHKANTSLEQFLSETAGPLYHLVYFDAFAPDIQPGLWTAAIFEKLFIALYNGGILVTYCCKGTVRKALQSVGFDVQKLPGPPGKREMIRAIKK